MGSRCSPSRAQRRRTSSLHRSVGFAGALIAIALAFTVLRPPPTSGPYARDFEAYYAAGATWNAGGDPWSRQIWRVEQTIGGVDASREEVLPYVGPAAALPLFGALARLPQPIAVRIWSGLLAAALAGLVLGALALGRTTSLRFLFGGLLLALVSGPAISGLALGQAALVSAAAIACALVAYDRHNLASGTLATLFAGVQPNLAVALLARLRDRTALTAAALGALVFAALTLFAGGGFAGLRSYAHRLGEHGAAERFSAIQHTPFAIAWSLGASPTLASAFGSACAGLALAAVVIAAWRARLDPLDTTLLALAALPLIVPFFHEHDFVVALIPLLVLAARARGAARGWAGAAAALVLVDWFGLAQRGGSGGAQIIALGVALACAFAALGRGARMQRSDAAAFVVLAAVACVAVPLGLAAHAPTWPDGLPADFHAPRGADISTVWADEQRVAGLAERHPQWGILRAVPLSGCVVLGVAVVLTGRRRGAA